MCIIGALAGCGMNKENLTKEQQDRIVDEIIQNYTISSIQFTSFTKDRNTGSYYLKFTINDDEKLQTGLVFSHIEELDDVAYNIGLSPVENFAMLERKKGDMVQEKIDIRITYLGD
ncbi:hypothetical protein BU202_06585 [Streptococcus cuniculi]|uniref:DUF1310 family protein n=2 Tax=Streptococcus cuniculi TaxID=1432788 RepID=A0A1Q8E7K7_9STRE|nr:hypothetical protein BU202_06585 [Streptococcus cuniculi]